jgi:hypothetical protein
MALIKLDCRVLDTALWVDVAARDLFITALLMAEPYTQKGASHTRDDVDVFIVPAGWYGIIRTNASSIVRRSGMSDEVGLAALKRLCSPNPENANQEFDGRHMTRVEGGYLVLDLKAYRHRDVTAADRAARYRARKSERILA